MTPLQQIATVVAKVFGDANFLQKEELIAKYNFVKDSVEVVDIGDQRYMLGIVKIAKPTNPLPGVIFHNPVEQRGYYAAMGREENGHADFSGAEVARACRKVMHNYFEGDNAIPRIHLDVVLETVKLSYDDFLSKMSEMCSEPNEIREFVKEHCVTQLGRKSMLYGTVERLVAQMNTWRMQAFLLADRPLYWILDFDKYSSQRYSRTGTASTPWGVQRDAAVWVPGADVEDEIVQEQKTGATPEQAMTTVLDRHLARFNAYLGRQAYQAQILKMGKLEHVASESEVVYGYDDAKNVLDKLAKHIWYIN